VTSLPRTSTPAAQTVLHIATHTSTQHAATHSCTLCSSRGPLEVRGTRRRGDTLVRSEVGWLLAGLRHRVAGSPRLRFPTAPSTKHPLPARTQPPTTTPHSELNHRWGYSSSPTSPNTFPIQPSQARERLAAPAPPPSWRAHRLRFFAPPLLPRRRHSFRRRRV